MKKHVFFKTCPLLISFYNLLFLKETVATQQRPCYSTDPCLITLWHPFVCQMLLYHFSYSLVIFISFFGLFQLYPERESNRMMQCSNMRIVWVYKTAYLLSDVCSVYLLMFLTIYLLYKTIHEPWDDVSKDTGEDRSWNRGLKNSKTVSLPGWDCSLCTT